MSSHFRSTLTLVRLIMKRDRLISTIWLVILIGLTVSVPISLQSIYGGSQEQLAGMAVTMQNPAMVALMGPAFDPVNYNIGMMNSHEMLLLTLITIGIMNIFFVARYTRGDEENGRIELIRSLPVGRLSALNAAMIAAIIMNILLAVVSGLGLYAVGLTGIDGLDFNASMLYGSVMGTAGIFFAAVTAFFAQLCSSSRSTIGYSFMVLFVLYLLRVVGDINTNAVVLSYVSPLGLLIHAKVCADNNWFPVFIVIAITIAAATAAYWLNSIRDTDQGFIPSRPGRRNASPLLRSSFGLSFRLLRNTLLAWTIGMLVFGATYGAIMGDIDSFITDNQFFKNFIGDNPEYSLAERMIMMLNMILALVCVMPVMSAMLKLRSEEKSGKVEHVLARVVSRTRHISGYLLIALICSLIMPFSSMLGLWSASSLVMPEPIAFISMFKGIMIYIPALWVMLGFTVLIIGCFPKFDVACWIYFGYSFFAVYMGPVLNLPEWSKCLSPFHYIPQLPVDKVNYIKMSILLIIAITSTVAGFIFYRRRDIQR